MNDLFNCKEHGEYFKDSCYICTTCLRELKEKARQLDNIVNGLHKLTWYTCEFEDIGKVGPAVRLRDLHRFIYEETDNAKKPQS